MPRAKKPTPAEPPKRGPGRPAIPGLRQLLVRVDDPAIEGLMMCAGDYDMGHSEAARMVLAAYQDSEEVRAALLAWYQARHPV